MFTTLYIDFSMVNGRIWWKFKLIQAFMHVLVSCKNEKVPIKNEGARVVRTFPPLQVYWDFIRRSRAANSAVHGRFWPNFKLIQDFIVFLVTVPAKMKMIRSKMIDCSQIYTSIYFRCSRAANSVVCGGILLKFKVIQASKHILVTCKNEEDPIKNERAGLLTTFLP